MRKYLKIDGERLDLSDDGVQLNGDVLTLQIINKDYQFTDFADKFFKVPEPITIYSCNIQNRVNEETGEEYEEETDEYVHQYFDKTTKLVSVKYDMPHNIFVLDFVEPDEMEERISELEDAMNFVLMGGEE